MEASKFLKEYIRMCTSIPCSKCALYGTSSCLDDVGDNSTPEDIELLVSAVEKWSAEHPVITNEDKFKQVFGENALRYIKGIAGLSYNTVIRERITSFLNAEYEEEKLNGHS